jgi:hypothetical protein
MANSLQILNSLQKGNAYIAQSQDLNIDASDTLLLLRNDSASPLVIDQIIVTNGNVASRYEGHIITAAFTAAGTAVVPLNLNTGAASTAHVTCIADETGNTQGTVIYDIASSPTATTPSMVIIQPMGLILARGISFAVDQVAESTAGACSIEFHFA